MVFCVPYGRGQAMFDFLCVAVQRLKSHRFAAYIVSCMITLAVIVLLLVYSNKLVLMLSQYSDFSINLFNLIEIEATR